MQKVSSQKHISACAKQIYRFYWENRVGQENFRKFATQETVGRSVACAPNWVAQEESPGSTGHSAS